ncbi:hypothetical protein BU15DRAFT_83000 [Melanogaster broomeanus]|nr:hypothetical protein BU15DRAFT_83000 [Melanogaster broomeanus]
MPPLNIVLRAMEQCQITVAELVITLLTSRQYKDHQLVQDLLAHSTDILNAFLRHPATEDNVIQKSCDIVKYMYLREIRDLVSGESGWHFRASNTSTKQLEDFSIKNTASKMESRAPRWWSLLGTLLGDEDTQSRGTVGTSMGGGRDDGDEGDDGKPASEDTLDNYWDQVDEIDLEGIINGLTGDSTALTGENKRLKRRAAIKTMKKTVISSILMQGINQKSNALQSILGFFLQSAHVPQKVINTLAHLGISISTDAINLAVRSLSAESQNLLRDLGRSVLASYAYNNFDVDLKSQVPTAEKLNDSLKHLTSGLLFPLVHGTTTNDLKCSEELWKKSVLNPYVEGHNIPRKHSCRDLLNLHREGSNDLNLSRRDKFNTWIFLHDLCTYGPEYLHQFQSMLQEPEAIEQIPLVKTPIYAARAMDINNSTVSGNIQAVIELLQQGGITDPAAPSTVRDDIGEEDLDSPDFSEHVVLVHSDLGTGEHLQSAQLHRSIESTPWNRFQHVVFIPGLFHLKMACADALWHCFIHPTTAREDETSLVRDITQIRPKETGIYASKPGFRRMHQLIGHAGICRRFDCWQTHVKSTIGCSSLESFAISKPIFEDLQAMANEIVHTYIATHRLQHLCMKPEKERDLQYENALLLNKYFLLYEELSYAMNCGDIGRVETSIVSWIPILKAVGKHKYATHMTNFLINVHFVYPAGLKRAVRYHRSRESDRTTNEMESCRLVRRTQ